MHLLGELEDGVFVFPRCQPQEKGGFHLPLQLRNRPFIVDCLLLVKAALQRVIQLQQFHKMRPAQKVRRLRTFWLGHIKPPDPDDITPAKSLPVPQGQIAAQPSEEVLPVLRPRFSALFKLHNIPPDLPVGFGDVRVDGLGRPELTGDVHLRDATQQFCVAGAAVISLLIWNPLSPRGFELSHHFARAGLFVSGPHKGCPPSLRTAR